MRTRFFPITLLAAALAGCGGCGRLPDQASGGGDPSTVAGGASGPPARDADAQPGRGTEPEKTPIDAPQPTGDMEGADLATKAAGAGGIDISYIAEDFVAAAVVHPRQAWQSNLLAKVYELPQVLLLEGLGESEVGFVFDAEDPRRQTAESLEEAIVLLAPTDNPP